MKAFWAGALLSAAVAGVSALIAHWSRLPPVLPALIIGMSLHRVASDPRLAPGIELCSRTLLRAGIALLGARITLGDLAGIGPAPALAVLAAMGLTIGLGLCLSRLFRRSAAEGLISGGAVAICGASAALAIASVLPRNEANARITLLTVAAVTALSTLAMFAYPLLAGLLHLDDLRAGVLLGGAIHDVAQVTAAGFMFSPKAGEIAVVVKLYRVFWLVPIVLLVAMVPGSSGPATAGRPSLWFPAFLIGFVAMVALSSAGLIGPGIAGWLGEASRWMLVIAIAATGIRTSLRDMASLGWRPVIALVIESLFILVLMMASVAWLVN